MKRISGYDQFFKDLERAAFEGEVAANAGKRRHSDCPYFVNHLRREWLRTYDATTAKNRAAKLAREGTNV